MEQEIQEAKNMVYNYKQYFSDYLPDLTKFGLKVALALLVFIGGRKVIQWVVSIIKKSMDKASVDKGVIQFTGSLLRVVLYVLLVFNIATNFGVKESSIAALLGTAGVTVGLALQGSLSNLAGGILILLMKPFRVGDYIVATGAEGTVRNIDIFYTRIVTTDNKVVVIPNGTLSNGNIINTSQEDYRLLILDFMVGYDADISKVREIILELMEQDMQICQDRARSVNIDKLNPGRVKLQAKAWVATEHYWDVRYRMLEKIKEELPKHGIPLF